MSTETSNRWTCFHCGETFTKTGAALDHFGDNPLRTPGCVAKVEIGHERGWLMHVRKLEKARDELAVLRSAEFADQASNWPPAMYVSRDSDYEKIEKIIDDLVKDLPFPKVQSRTLEQVSCHLTIRNLALLCKRRAFRLGRGDRKQANKDAARKAMQFLVSNNLQGSAFRSEQSRGGNADG